MKAELVLNDLSVISADSNDIARDWLTETLSAVAELIYQDVCNPILHAEHDLYDILLTDDYGFSEWLEELEPQDDLRLLAMQLTTKTPTHSFLKNIKDGNDDFVRSEFFLKTQPEKKCNALGAALISDGISVSFPSQPQWCVSFIEIQQILYNAEDLNPEQTVQHRVRSISKPEHVDNVVRDWRNAIGEKSHNADELLNRWQSAFPYLDLCGEYKDKFLSNLRGETFKSVKKRLRELDNSCHIWTTEIIYSMYARPESNQTMNQKKLANLRLATCANNGEQHFIMHCDIQPKGYRLYWFEDKQRKRLTIGYAGKHLETARFKAQ
jgi:hypothetical protein